MCSWIETLFDDCNDKDHRFQVGITIKCQKALANEEWCDEEEMTELDVNLPSTFDNIKVSYPRCGGFRVRFVDIP